MYPIPQNNPVIVPNALGYIQRYPRPTSVVPYPCCQTPATPPSHNQAVTRGASPRLKEMPRRAGTSIVEPLDLTTRPAHASVSGTESAQRMAVADIAIGPETNQKTARAKSSFTRSLCRQNKQEISSWGTLSGEGSESSRIARLQKQHRAGGGSEGQSTGLWYRGRSRY